MIKIRCDNCQGGFEMDERLAGNAKGGKVECRYCGASVSVDKREAPAAAKAEPENGTGDAFEQLLADICEPGGAAVPLPKVPPMPREPMSRPRPTPLPRAAEPRGPGDGVPLTAAGAMKAPAPAPPKAPERPVEPARPVRTKPSYTVSRSVVLDPETLVSNRVVGFFPEKPEMEPYRVLRTRILQAAREKGGNTIMITSAFPQEGKTLTAVNLALTFSKGFSETALLVDCDLRQQRVCEMLGYPGEKGLGDYLGDGCAVSDMVAWPGVEKLTVISGGRTVAESSELLGSPAMKALVEDMKGRYGDRYVFFDVPSVLAGADALTFAPLVDHILFVVRAGRTPIPEALRALAMLPPEKVIGVVFNGQER